MQSKMGVKHWVQCVGPGLCPASRTQWGIKGRRISLLGPAHAVISLTPICWNRGCVTSITVSLTVPRLQSRQSAVFPSHSYFCSLSGTPHPGHCCVHSLTHSTTLLCFIFTFLCSPVTLPSSASPTCPILSASTSQTLSVTCAFSLPPSFLLPPVSLQSLQKPMCQVGRQFFDSSTLSAKCIQIWTALSALEKWNNSKYLVNFMVINTPNQADEL